MWTIYYLYHLIEEQQGIDNALAQLSASLTGKRSLYILVVFLLMPFNWWLEIRKWQLIVSPFERISFSKAIAAVMGGLAFGMATPNRIGEYGIRALFMSPSHRKTGVWLTILSGVAQLLVTFMAGLLALFFFANDLRADIFLSSASTLYWIILAGSGLSVILLLFFYFDTAGVVKVFRSWKMTGKLFPEEADLKQITKPLKIRILFFSTLRYGLFAGQYCLLWYSFGAGLEAREGLVCIGLIFLIMAFIPTIALAELGIRGQVSVWVASVYSSNFLAVVGGSVGIWMINLFIPAMIGSVYLWSLRLSGKRMGSLINETNIIGQGRNDPDKI